MPISPRRGEPFAPVVRLTGAGGAWCGRSAGAGPSTRSAARVAGQCGWPVCMSAAWLGRAFAATSPRFPRMIPDPFGSQRDEPMTLLKKNLVGLLLTLVGGLALAHG